MIDLGGIDAIMTMIHGLKKWCAMCSVLHFAHRHRRVQGYVILQNVTIHSTYRLDWATLSISIFFLMVCELGLFAAQRMISSASASDMVLMFLNATFRAPSTIKAMH